MTQNPHALRAVLFDLDGTLADTPRGIVQALRAALETLGAPGHPDERLRQTIGQPLPEAFASLLGVPSTDPLVTRGVQCYQAAFRAYVLPQAPALVFPGVQDGLTTLRRQGLTLMVATNKMAASAHALLDAARLAGHFHGVLTADHVRQPKPHAEMAWRALTRLKLQPAQVVMVGDTEHDVLMARGAGMRSIAVTYGVHSAAQLATAQPTWTADDFQGVVSQLTALSATHDHAS